MTEQEIEIKQPASDEEVAAIVSAVMAMRRSGVEEERPAPERSQWREAGKREALRGELGESRQVSGRG